MIKNPVMFVVEIGLFLSVLLTINPNLFGSDLASERGLNGLVSLILFITILFANYAEALAEGRGKAQASSLRQTKKDMIARRVLSDGNIEEVSAQELKRGDIVSVQAGEVIPNDGEVLEGEIGRAHV